MIDHSKFSYKGRSLFETIDLLLGYDPGAPNAGPGDEEMCEAVRSYLKSLDPESFRVTSMLFARRYFEDTGIKAGYTLENVVAFIGWLRVLGFSV